MDPLLQRLIVAVLLIWLIRTFLGEVNIGKWGKIISAVSAVLIIVWAFFGYTFLGK